MQGHNMKKVNRKLVKIASICLFFVIFGVAIIMAAGTDDSIRDPEGRHFELRAVEVIGNDGETKQVIMELWGNDVEFKRI